MSTLIPIAGDPFGPDPAPQTAATPATPGASRLTPVDGDPFAPDTSKGPSSSPGDTGFWPAAFGFVGGAAKTVAAIPRDIGQEASAGLSEYEAGANPQPGGSKLAGAGHMAMGAMRMLGAIPTGAARALAGDPTRNVVPQDNLAGRVVANTVEDLASMGIAGSGSLLAQAGKKVAEAAYPPLAGAAETAVKAVNKRLTDAGMTAEGALKEMAKTPDKPMTVADVGGEGVQALGGAVARKGGTTGTQTRTFLNKRDDAASDRLEDDLGQHLGTESVRKAVDRVADARSEEAQPLYAKAYEGGSVAPLEHQFTNAFNNASKEVAEWTKIHDQTAQEILTPLARRATTDDVYTNSASLTKQKVDVEPRLAYAAQRVKQAQADKTEALQMLRQAQSDAANGVKGGIWTPGIARLLQEPEIQKGIQQGIRLEQMNAAAEGRNFNPYEYAITHYENGEPVVSKVPNTRLLAAAKKGLDARLEQPGMRNELTGRLTETGRAVDGLRRSLLKELNTANPDYAAANAAWSGKTRMIQATKVGQDVFKNSPEVNAEDLADMTQGEREFAKLGVADIARKQILSAGFNADEAKRIMGSKWAKRQLAPFFDTPEEFNRFMDSVTAETQMFEARQNMIRGSQTATRLKGDQALQETSAGEEALKHGAHMVSAASTGDHVGLLKLMVKGWRSVKQARELGVRNNPELDDAIAHLLFNPNVSIHDLNPAPVAQPTIASRVSLSPRAPSSRQQQQDPNSILQGLGVAQ